MSKCDPFKDDIKNMIGQGMTNPEIAKEIGVSRPTLAMFIQIRIGGNPNYLKRITKHKHLHEKLLKLKLKHSDSEMIKITGLTKSELKSCMTCAYQRKEFSHIRKETRRRDAWSSKELKFLLRYSGIISQDDINSHLKRGKNRIVIKEKLQLLGLCSKNVNGLTYSQFTNLFKKEPISYLATSAGSPSSKFAENANWKLVPWCHIEEMLQDNYIKHSEAIATYIKTMSLFQKWVHGKNYWRSLTREPFFRLEE